MIALPTDPANPGVFPPAPDLPAQLRGFGPVGITAMLVVLLASALTAPFSAAPVLLWALASRTPWPDLGYVAPRSWARTVLIATGLGVLFKLAMKSLVMPLLGAPPVNAAYHYLAGSPLVLPFAFFAVLIGAGIGEETVFRGYLFERLGRLLGDSVAARTAIVLLTAVLFAAAHYTGQGVPGVEQAVVTGLVFGAVYAKTRRLVPLMVAHAAFDLTALALIYWGWEEWVAHLVFR